MTRGDTQGGLNIAGPLHNVRKLVKRILIAKDLPCPSKRTIVNYSAPMVRIKLVSLVVRLLEAIKRILSTVVI